MLRELLKEILRYDEHKQDLYFLNKLENYPNLPQQPYYNTLVTLATIPSFKPINIWLFQQNSQHLDCTFKTCHIPRQMIVTYRVRRIIIKQPDIALNPTPITYGADGIVPNKEAEQLLQDLSTLTIQPFISPPQIGIDGTSYCIEFGNFWTASSLRWWQEPVAQWQQLAILNKTYHKEAYSSL